MIRTFSVKCKIASLNNLPRIQMRTKPARFKAVMMTEVLIRDACSRASRVARNCAWAPLFMARAVQV